jgi:hypothetical protein
VFAGHAPSFGGGKRQITAADISHLLFASQFLPERFAVSP